MRLWALYLSSLRGALRYLAVLLVVVFALVALILVSLPERLFTDGDVPKLSLAIVSGEAENTFSRNLDTALSQVEVIDEALFCAPDEAEQLLAEGAVDAIIYIPDDILDALVYGEHATIIVKATDPFMGALVFSATSQAVETLDTVQNYALVYQEAVAPSFGSQEERYDAIMDFDMKLLRMALGRLGTVDSPTPVSPYLVQVVTLLLFLTVSVAAIFVAIGCARLYAQGYVRHLRWRGVGFLGFFAVQVACACSIALVLGLLLGLALSVVGLSINPLALAASAVLLALVLTPVCLMFAGFAQRGPTWATTRTLFGCIALLFFLLFAGGGFYPTFLMQSSLRVFNPTWLADVAAHWSLGVSLAWDKVALFLLPLVLASVVCWLEWRRAS
ncbi:MAG: ABC transporter permease [Coriobacteriales bacterium]|nr:ABC transporter permease [Coriobacteriales bacterium]